MAGVSEQFSRSVGRDLPTHFTSQVSNPYNVNSLEISQIQLPQISKNINMIQLTNKDANYNNYINSRQQSKMTQHKQSATYDLTKAMENGPFRKQFVAHNKKIIQKFLKNSFGKEGNDVMRGYQEISNASQHLKKHHELQNDQFNNSMIEPSIENSFLDGPNDTSGSAQLGQRSNSTGFSGMKKRGAINSKVMETWINETLADAEHLDIPGVILKPEHKNPISRYSIDRLTLTNAGIPNEAVDRVYRSLFVYSVGFYELIRKLVAHCGKKYSIITSIWKVFSVLLEYCCQSDYRMLISEITNQHDEEVAKMDRDFQQKCQEFLNNEKILKQNMEVMQKFSEELEKERTNERTLRLKLEEEYMQNSKNHEEEVQLRLKFESKLNSMHSIHRELEIKHKRLQHDLQLAQSLIVKQEQMILDQAHHIVELKSVKTEQESQIAFLDEKKSGLERDVNIKNRLVQDIDIKMKKTQDESDLITYQVHEQSKEITEQRLKIDTLETKIAGLQAEKNHLQISLDETTEFRHIFEDKANEMRDKYTDLLLDFNEVKQQLVGFEEIFKNCNEKMDSQKELIQQLKSDFKQLDDSNSKLQLEYVKTSELYRICKLDLDETIDRLHQINRFRHELELRLKSAEEANDALELTLKDKMMVIQDKDETIEKLESQRRENTNKMEQMAAQIHHQESMTEMKLQSMQEKMDALTENIQNEKESKEQWVMKFEREQKDHSLLHSELLTLHSKLKDLQLDFQNLNIKYKSQLQTNDQLNDRVTQAINENNEKTVQIENIKRENKTMKNTFDNLQGQKKEYIKKMMLEMQHIRQTLEQEIVWEQMEKEDYLSRAGFLYRVTQKQQLDIVHLNEQLTQQKQELQQLNMDLSESSMSYEDYRTRLIQLIQSHDKLLYTHNNIDQELQTQVFLKEQQRIDFEQEILKLQVQHKEYEIKTDQLMEEAKTKYDQIMTRVMQVSGQLAEVETKNKDLEKQIITEREQSKKKGKDVAITGRQNKVQSETLKQEVKDQEVQTINSGPAKITENLKAKQQEIQLNNSMMNARPRIVSNHQSDLQETGQPGNKLVNEAAKRRDSMNRKLKEQEAIINNQSKQLSDKVQSNQLQTPLEQKSLKQIESRNSQVGSEVQLSINQSLPRSHQSKYNDNNDNSNPMTIQQLANPQMTNNNSNEITPNNRPQNYKPRIQIANTKQQVQFQKRQQVNINNSHQQQIQDEDQQFHQDIDYQNNNNQNEQYEPIQEYQNINYESLNKSNNKIQQQSNSYSQQQSQQNKSLNNSNFVSGPMTDIRLNMQSPQQMEYVNNDQTPAANQELQSIVSIETTKKYHYVDGSMHQPINPQQIKQQHIISNINNDLNTVSQHSFTPIGQDQNQQFGQQQIQSDLNQIMDQQNKQSVNIQLKKQSVGYKKPEGGPGIKALFRGAATRHNQ